jgi:hypothetical protein
MRAEIQSVAWMTPAEVRRELTRTSLTVCRETRSFRQLHRALLPRSKEETLLAALLPRAARWGQACRRVTEGRRNRSSALGKAFRSGVTVSSNPSSSSGESGTNRAAAGDVAITILTAGKNSHRHKVPDLAFDRAGPWEPVIGRNTTILPLRAKPRHSAGQSGLAAQPDPRNAGRWVRSKGSYA